MSLTRILYISCTTGGGGAEASLATLLSGLERSRFRPILACPAPNANCIHNRSSIGTYSTTINPSPSTEKERNNFNNNAQTNFHFKPENLSPTERQKATSKDNNNKAKVNRQPQFDIKPFYNGNLPEFCAALDIPHVIINPPMFARSANPFRIFSQYAAIRQARKQIRHIVSENNISFIHANTLPAAIIADGAPTVCHLRDLRTTFAACISASNKTQAAIAISHVIQKKFARFFDRIALIHNGIDTELFSPSFSDNNKETRVLMVANLVPWKRHDIFIRCFSEIQKNLPNARATIAASPHSAHPGYMAQLQKLAQDLKVTDMIEWLIDKSYSEMPEIYRTANVLIHPTSKEPFGRAVAEALACGVPIVAAATAGPAEILEKGGGELITDYTNPTAFANAALKFLCDRELAKQAGSSGRKNACENFSAHLHAKRIMAFYDNFLKEQIT